MKPEVVIVHAVDTEGPLFESVEAKWLRLEEMFGITTEEKTEKNLQALLNGELEVDVPLENIRAVFSSHLSQFNSSWPEIDEMLSESIARNFGFDSLIRTIARGGSHGIVWIILVTISIPETEI